MIFQIPFGYLSDRIGRKYSLLLGLAITSASMIALSLARDFWLMMVVSGIYGAGYAMIFPSAAALAVEGANREKRALGSGVFHLAFTEGVVFGAPLFSVIAGRYGPSVGLMSSALAPLLALVVASLVLRK